MLYKNIIDLIGNTPLLEISEEVHSFKGIQIYAKLEYLNPFGSVKDRTALGMVEGKMKDIKNNNKIIIESSSGNTGKALASIAGILGTKFETISNRINVDEQKDLLALLGAKIKQIPGKSECPNPDNPNDPLKMIDDKVSKNPEKYFYTDQYKNIKNVEYHFKTTGKEIWEDLGNIDYFFGGLGTTGSTRGTASFLKEKNQNIKNIGIVSSSDDLIPGIRTIDEMWEVGLFNKNFYDYIQEVNSSEALDYMRILIQKVGMHCGPTTGATYGGLIKYLEKNIEKIPKNSKIVFIACDGFSPYLSYIKKRKQEFFNKIEKEYSIFDMTKNFEKSAKEISSDELNNEQYLIIDIRNNISFKNIHISKSINIEEERVFEMIDDNKFPFSKELKLVFVCTSGRTTKKISGFLNEKGYETYYLKGGLEEWFYSGGEVKNF